MGSCGWTRWTGPVRLMRNSAEAVARSSAAAECVKKRRVLVLMLVFSRLQRGEPSAAEPQPACPERLEMELAPHLARLSVLAGRGAVSLSARLAMTHMSACRFSIPKGLHHSAQQSCCLSMLFMQPLTPRAHDGILRLAAKPPAQGCHCGRRGC